METPPYPQLRHGLAHAVPVQGWGLQLGLVRPRAAGHQPDFIGAAAMYLGIPADGGHLLWKSYGNPMEILWKSSNKLEKSDESPMKT